MNDFNTQLQIDEFIPADEFLQWVEAMEAREASIDEDDQRWTDIREDIEREWAELQPMPF